MIYYTATATGAIRGRFGRGFKLVAAHSDAIVVEPPDIGGGTQLFTASFENADSVATWQDQEISFGESFAKGEVPTGTRIRAMVNGTAIPCQVSNRRVWPDGSLRVADVKALVPSIAAGASITVTWERVDGGWGAHDTALHSSPVAITSNVALEYAFTSWKGRTAANALTEERGPKVFRSADMLAAGNNPWIDNVVAGPVCCEWRASDMAVLPGGGKDLNFGAILYAQAWGGTPGNPKRIRFVYRTMQGWSTDTPADEQGIRADINLKVNGVVVRGAAAATTGWSAVNTWKGGFLMSAGPEGTMDWYDVATNAFVTPPRLVYRRNIAHGVASKFVPPIDTANPAMPMTAAAMSYAPAKRGPLRPIQDDVADAVMIPWTTSKPMAWTIAAHARATAAQLDAHQRYCRAAALGMGAMTSVGFHRTTRKIVSYLPPSKQTNEATLGTSIYGTGKPANAAGDLRPEIQNLDAAHFPQMAFWPAYEHGEQHLIDLAYHEVTLPGLFEATNYGFFGNSTINGVTVPFGGISYRGQIRAASHQARSLGNALAIGNPADPHWVMARDYLNHWAEMIERVAQEEDLWRVGSGQPSGLTRTDGRRFQDLKALVPNNEPTYKVWMHTLGLGSMAHSYGMTEFPRLKELAERFAYLPTVMAGGYHNDNDYLMKPDAVEAVGYEVICMDGLTSNGEFRRYWRPGQWSGNLTDCTYKADGQTVQFTTPAYGATTMLDGMVMTASYTRGTGEPHWADTTKPQPAGLTLGIPYYSVQSSGLTCKLSLTLGGPPVTFTPAGGVDQVGHIFRRPVAGVHAMKTGADVSADANSYLVQVASALDMVAHYCLPDDPRLAMARSNLRRLLTTRPSPNAYDERGKTTVPATIIAAPVPTKFVSGVIPAKKPTVEATATMSVAPTAIPVSGFTTTTGDGATVADSGAGTLTITYGTTATSMRGSTAGLTVGNRYRVFWTVSNSNATQGQAGFGTSLGGPQYRPTMGGVTGANSFDFTAETSTLYLTFQRASAGTSTFSALSIAGIPQVSWAALSPQPVTPSFWTALSSGVTVNGTSGNITIPATGTLLSAAGSFSTTIGKLYRLVWSNAGNTVQVVIGGAQGSTTLKSSGVNHPAGANAYEFTATSSTTWIQFQRSASGTVTVFGAALQEAVGTVDDVSFDSLLVTFDKSTITFDRTKANTGGAAVASFDSSATTFDSSLPTFDQSGATMSVSSRSFTDGFFLEFT